MPSVGFLAVCCACFPLGSAAVFFCFVGGFLSVFSSLLCSQVTGPVVDVFLLCPFLLFLRGFGGLIIFGC